MSFALMLSRGVLSYFFFRSTRGIISGGLDKMSNPAQKMKATTCEECGRVYGGGVDFCHYCQCATEKLYKDYEYQSRVDDNLKLAS